MVTLFVSDLHLSETTHASNDRFLDFLKAIERRVDALYLLGDIFEFWIGDDDLNPFTLSIISALRQLVDSGTPVYFMHGNRDFLVKDKFLDATGCQFLEDLTIIDLYGTSTLLMHGDTMCTDDESYQYFRKRVRDPFTQKCYLALPLRLRRWIAQRGRKASRALQQQPHRKQKLIGDVVGSAIVETLKEYDVPIMIHGHTHRPAVHYHQINNKHYERIVLSDWVETQGHVLVCDKSARRMCFFSSADEILDKEIN